MRCRDGVFRQNERHHHVHKERAFTQNADNDQNRISQSDGSELRMVRDERRDISNDADEEEGCAAGNLKMAELFIQFPADEPLDGGVLDVEEPESEQPEEAQQGQLACRFKPGRHAADVTGDDRGRAAPNEQAEKAEVVQQLFRRREIGNCVEHLADSWIQLYHRAKQGSDRARRGMRNYARIRSCRLWNRTGGYAVSTQSGGACPARSQRRAREDSAGARGGESARRSPPRGEGW